MEKLAGDLRELLCLPRVEELMGQVDMAAVKQESLANAQHELQQQIEAAPEAARMKFANMLGLHTNATPSEIAAAVPRIKDP
eukprot:4818548-Amphidinium_carterae.1